MTALIVALFLWSTGEYIFLGAFFAIVAIIIITLIASTMRTIRIVREQKTDEIRWASEFHDLPASSRACRHEFTGEFTHRVCDNEFNCGQCATHAKLLSREAEHTSPQPALVQLSAGFSMPLDRLYHRGHTWVKPEEDGTYTIGVDDFASRLLGVSGDVELPDRGTRLSVNSTAMNFLKGGLSVRFLSPIEGEVLETSKGEKGWFVRMKPLHAEVNTGHLLRGRAEVGAWIEREFSRLQRLLADPAVGATLPDGGMAVEDIAEAYPEKNWEAIYSTLLLEP